MRRSQFIVLSVLLDALFVNVGFVSAFLIRFAGQLPAYNFNAYLALVPFITLAYVAACWANGLYEPESLDDTWTIVARTFVSATIGTVLTAAFAFFGGTATVSFARLTLLIAWPVIVVLLASWRYLFLRFGSISWPKQRVLILGAGSTALDLVREISSRSHWGWTCVGVVASGGEVPASEVGALLVGTPDEVVELASRTGANRLIVVSPSTHREFVEDLVLDEALHVRIDVVPELYEVFLGNFDSQIGDIPLVHVTGARAPEYFGPIKRVSDIAMALVGLVLASPVMLVASIFVLLEDRGPILYRQERVGRDREPFTVLKMRTMRTDAETLSGPVLATDEDPRVTRTGKVLRAYRIDELPQLVNILKGDMSFVGPRPERPFFVEQHLKDIRGYGERFYVRPGVTGLAQVSGGYATTAERKLKYDLIYLYHRTLAMDARILVETFKVVLTGRGAR